MGGVNFSDLVITIQEAAGETAAVTINYGMFIQHLVDFIIVAFAIFMVIRVFEKAKRKEEAKPVAPAVIPNEEKLLVEIRDLLKVK